MQVLGGLFTALIVAGDPVAARRARLDRPSSSGIEHPWLNSPIGVGIVTARTDSMVAFVNTHEQIEESDR